MSRAPGRRLVRFHPCGHLRGSLHRPRAGLLAGPAPLSIRNRAARDDRSLSSPGNGRRSRRRCDRPVLHPELRSRRQRHPCAVRSTAVSRSSRPVRRGTKSHVPRRRPCARRCLAVLPVAAASGLHRWLLPRHPPLRCAVRRAHPTTHFWYGLHIVLSSGQALVAASMRRWGTASSGECQQGEGESGVTLLVGSNCLKPQFSPQRTPWLMPQRSAVVV